MIERKEKCKKKINYGMEWLVFVIVGCINSLILGGCLFLVSSLC